jgi:hypothetical protein
MLFPTLLMLLNTTRVHTPDPQARGPLSLGALYIYIDDINYPQVITYVGSCADARSVPSELN